MKIAQYTLHSQLMDVIGSIHQQQKQQHQPHHLGSLEDADGSNLLAPDHTICVLLLGMSKGIAWDHENCILDWKDLLECGTVCG